MRSFLIASLAVAAFGLVGCASGAANGCNPSTVPVMDVNLPSASIPAPIWFHTEPGKPQFVPSGYTQLVAPQACAPQACAPAVQAVQVPQAPAWVPAPTAAPAAPYCP